MNREYSHYMVYFYYACISVGSASIPYQYVTWYVTYVLAWWYVIQAGL